jgi:hypothetical protein
VLTVSSAVSGWIADSEVNGLDHPADLLTALAWSSTIDHLVVSADCDPRIPKLFRKVF